MSRRQIQLARALHTASLWHSSEDALGVQMLILSSTRKVHSEAHRASLVRAIRDNISAVLGPNFSGDGDSANRMGIQRLIDLWETVEKTGVGEEWLSFDENNRLNDYLYEANAL